MAATALGIYVMFALMAFGWRAWRQYRTTGDHGFRGFSGGMGSAAWIGGRLLTLGGVAGLAALLIELWAGDLPLRFTEIDTTGFGLVVMLLGAAVTLIAQTGMGASWRVGVDSSEVTRLVTTGLFGWVRNPIFTAMLIVLVGVVLTTRNVAAVIAVIASAAGMELQVRYVEEPYLIRVHGERYLSYARRTGRFVPRLGRLN